MGRLCVCRRALPPVSLARRTQALSGAYGFTSSRDVKKKNALRFSPRGHHDVALAGGHHLERGGGAEHAACQSNESGASHCFLRLEKGLGGWLVEMDGKKLSVHKTKTESRPIWQTADAGGRPERERMIFDLVNLPARVIFGAAKPKRFFWDNLSLFSDDQTRDDRANTSWVFVYMIEAYGAGVCGCAYV